MGVGAVTAAGVFNISAPTPQRVTGRVEGFLPGSFMSFVFLKLPGVPPLPTVPTKSLSKSDQKSNQKIDQIFDPKWSPKGTFKITKI